MRTRIIVLVTSILFLSCQREVSNDSVTFKNEVIEQENQLLDAKITKQTTQTWLNGYIIDEQRSPVPGAMVECGGKSAITDSKGFFYFTEKLTTNKDYTIVKVSKAGFLNGFRTFTPNRQKLSFQTIRIELQATGNSQTIQANAGGSITLDNIKLTFPTDAVTKPDGTAYSGDVKVMARYINPDSKDFPYIMPGILSGLNSSGQIRALQSLGMAHVELSDPSGNRLEVAPGKTVRLEMPATATGPASVPLWRFNEKYGIWIQHGVATKQGNYYVAEANHFSVWNIDLEFNNFELNLKFQTTTAFPVANLRVDVYRPNNIFVTGFYTDNNGEATLINCPSNESLNLKISYPCDTINYTLAPVTQTRNELITVNSPAIQNYQFQGTLFQCNNQALTNQPYQLMLSGPSAFVVLTGITDALGRINTGTAIPSCIGSPLTAQTVAFNNNRFYFSSTTLVNPGVNIYNATLCDSIGNGQSFNDSDIVNLPDPNLRQRVRDAINKQTGNIYYADIKNIRTLRIYSSPPIATILGLQYFTGLDTLAIGPINNINHTFSDLTPISGLTRIKSLQFSKSNISDLSPLQNLSSLGELYLQNNQISNISILQSLTGLRTLWLPGNPIQNITPLQGLTNLTELWLNDCQVSTISALQNLTNLTSLNIGFNPLVNITPLQNLTSLRILTMRACQIVDISPLQNLNRIQTLYADSNRIINATVLQNLTSLLFLDISDNLITTIPSLNSCTTLGTVDFSDNQISSLTPLQGHPSLRTLNLRNNFVFDLSPLQNITSLRQIVLDSNNVTNLAPLGAINQLQILQLRNNNLTDITSLITSNPNLNMLFILQGNSIPPNQISAFQTTHPSCQIF
jgi:Leucine-rich repeat (LRR) protein